MAQPFQADISSLLDTAVHKRVSLERLTYMRRKIAMSRRRKKKRKQGEVELNMAAMLDMAFQLLTFFILTFRPAPVEGQISLKLPPPQPITGGTMKAGSDTANTDPAKGVNTLVISVFSDPSGDIGSMAVGEGRRVQSAQPGAAFAGRVLRPRQPVRSSDCPSRQ